MDVIAAQMWLLGRILPFMIGSNVPEGNEHWQNFLTLLEIMDYLMAQDITEDEVGYLSILIQKHHEEFVRLYTNASAIPKHHFMVHMARLTLKYVEMKLFFIILHQLNRYGPLVKLWTMRYEAKHNHLKKLAQNIGNFINIAWTLAPVTSIGSGKNKTS